MKLQIDTAAKTIKIDQNVNFGDLVKHLEKLLPKSSPFGSWKDFTLETNTIIYNWGYPIYYQNEWWLQSPLPTFTVTANDVANISGVNTVSEVYNFELN